MKSRATLLLLLALILAIMPASAQVQLNQDQSNPDKPGPLFFVKIAADVAGNLQQANLNGYTGIYVSDQNWPSGLKDSDLGAFLKLKEAKPGRSVAFLYAESKDAAICVFFDGKSPFGAVAVRAGSSGSIEPGDIQAAYKDISKDMLKKSAQEWHFNESEVNADDGTALPAFQISK